MPNIKSTRITTSQAIKLIEDARNAELCRDISEYRRILNAVWGNLDDEPALGGLDALLQAEILRCCGFFLSYYGHSRNLRNYQERGRNFLTNAIEMFDKENLPDKAAEAKVILALCYWYEGATNECELILAETEKEYADNQLHPVRFQIAVNRMASHYRRSEYEQALSIIEQISIPIELCKDIRLKTLFHTQAGIIYQILQQPEKAIFHTSEAIKNAQRNGNIRYTASCLNNLGNVYKDIGKFDDAHQCIDRAYKTYIELEEIGWAANVLDTKAQVYLAENKLASALTKIDEALTILRKGEDFAGLIEALSTKCKILLKLDKVSEFILLLLELTEVAKMQLGEVTAKKYADEFAKLLYPLDNTSYTSEVRAFKASLLRKHLTDSNGQITKAAATLGISHQNLSNILNNQFPELFIELGIHRRLRRNGEKRDILKNIAPIKLSDSQMACESGLRLNEDASYYTFALNGKHLPSLKTKQNVVVLVEASEQTAGATVIMQNQKTDEFHCGVLEMDKLTGIFYLNDSAVKDGFPFLLDDFKYYGKVVGYCLLEEDSGIQILFRPF
jgi:tetratricopeptide (TPR) repeat protein